MLPRRPPPRRPRVSPAPSCSLGGVTRGLVLACHPLPTLAVTAFATLCALALRGSPGTALAVAAAALAGQLCVGWTNDARDAARDRAAARLDKPIARGLVSARTVGVAAVLAGLAAVPLSLRLGWRAGLLHLVAVAAALGYNLRLKFTVLSPLPYAVAFGLLPVVVTLAVDGAWAPAGQVLGAAVLGMAAHFGNTVGDTDADRLTGVRGLPQRLGPRTSLLTMSALTGVAGAVLLAQILAGPGSAAAVVGAVVLAAGVIGAGVVALAGVAGRGPSLQRGPGAWRLTLASVALVAIGVIVSLAA